MNADLAALGAAIGEPTRAAMLAMLSDGRAYPAGQVAIATRTKPQTASFHLEKLLDAGLVVRVKQGRHNYYALAGEPVANALEALSLIAQPKKPLVDGMWRGSDQLRFARTCYGHLAGKAGVALVEGLCREKYLEDDGSAFWITPGGEAWLAGQGINLRSIKRRPLTRKCLDWSERKHHLAGALGVALTKQLFEMKWLAPVRGSRAVRVTTLGRASLEKELGLLLEA